MSQKEKVAVKTRQTTIVQETNSIGQHRIIIIKDGVPSHSAWAEHYALAVFGRYRGSLSGNAAIPQGVFTVSLVDSESLS
jgi:hypothetical protein